MKKLLYIFFAAALMATACTRELVPEQSVLSTTVAPEDGDMALVTFTVTVPDSPLFATQTKALHPMDAQPTIENGDLYVAVFGEGTNEEDGLGGNLQNFLKATLKNTIAHDYTAESDESDPTKTYTYEYELLMPLSEEPLILDFMVGACNSEGVPYNLDHPLPVKYEKDVMPLLFSVNGNAAYSQRIRINGVFPHDLGNGNYETTQYVDDGGQMLPIEHQDYVAEEIEELKSVRLIRNFAKITFTASSSAPFTLDGFYLVDTPLSGAVAPYSVSAGYNTVYTTATAAGAVMATYKGHVLSMVLSSGIEGKEFKDPGEFEYMYERSIPTYSSPVFAESGAILKVTWKNQQNVATALRGQTCYYKVSFVDESGYVPILRNIQYDFEVSDINAEQHPTSAAAAYAGGFLGDVSASISTAMLDEISNNKSRITVSEMSKTSIGDSKTFSIDFYFYPVYNNSEVVVTNGKVSQAAGGKTVTISTSIMNESGEAVADVSAVQVTHNSNGTDNHGTITVTVSASETGKVKTGKVRILGQVEGMRALYRDVVFTVMEKQKFEKSTTTANDDDEPVTTTTNSSVTPLASDTVNQETTVTIILPDGLPRDIFPLQIKIEAQNNGLTSIPDNTATPAISALPVKYGPSAFRSGNSYYFVKTITFDDYATLNGVAYSYTNAFPCKFKTRLSSGNATSIKINDINEEYFVEKTLTLSVQ